MCRRLLQENELNYGRSYITKDFSHPGGIAVYNVEDVRALIREIMELPLEYQLELADMWDKYKAAKAEQERSTQ